MRHLTLSIFFCWFTRRGSVGLERSYENAKSSDDGPGAGRILAFEGGTMDAGRKSISFGTELLSTFRSAALFTSAIIPLSVALLVWISVLADRFMISLDGPVGTNCKPVLSSSVTLQIKMITCGNDIDIDIDIDAL